LTTNLLDLGQLVGQNLAAWQPANYITTQNWGADDDDNDDNDDDA